MTRQTRDLLTEALAELDAAERLLAMELVDSRELVRVHIGRARGIILGAHALEDFEEPTPIPSSECARCWGDGYPECCCQLEDGD